jgi:hypothetical protein
MKDEYNYIFLEKFARSVFGRAVALPPLPERASTGCALAWHN